MNYSVRGDLKDDKNLLIVIYFRDEFINQMGEQYGVECRLSAFNIITEYKCYANDLFESFDGMEMQQIMRKSMEQYMNFSYLIQSGIIE